MSTYNIPPVKFTPLSQPDRNTIANLLSFGKAWMVDVESFGLIQHVIRSEFDDSWRLNNQDIAQLLRGNEVVK